MSILARRINRRLFTDCVANNRGAMVMFPELDGYCQGTFVQMHRRYLELQLPCKGIKGIHHASICCVTFQKEAKQHVFLSLITNYRKLRQFDISRLTVATPRQVFAEPRRSARRIVVPNNSGLVTRVTADGGFAWVPRAVNLSVAGALLDFGEQGAPNLPIGIQLDLAMTMGVDSTTVHAEVLRRKENQYGLRFCHRQSGSVLKPPNGLRRIVKRLERSSRGTDSRAFEDDDQITEDPFSISVPGDEAPPIAPIPGDTDDLSFNSTMAY